MQEVHSQCDISLSIRPRQPHVILLYLTALHVLDFHSTLFLFFSCPDRQLHLLLTSPSKFVAQTLTQGLLCNLQGPAHLVQQSAGGRLARSARIFTVSRKPVNSTCQRETLVFGVKSGSSLSKSVNGKFYFLTPVLAVTLSDRKMRQTKVQVGNFHVSVFCTCTAETSSALHSAFGRL